MPVFFLVVFAVYALVSGLAFIVYAMDKHAAQRGARRIPERTLHAIELFGGWPGALLAQRVLRHKNRKASYQAVYWLIVATHAALWGIAWWSATG